MKKSNFMAHRVRIKIEGFWIEKLLSELIKEKIKIKNIRYINDVEAIMTVAEFDIEKIKKIAKNKYKISILSQGGYIYALSCIWGRKALIAGIAIFFIVIYYQSIFISEVRVYGYKTLTEESIRETLKEVGIYEGARKIEDENLLKDIKLQLYEELDPVAFVGIEYKGSLVEVTIEEGNSKERDAGIKKPCNIVATKSGYIYYIRVKEGLGLVQDGDFVTEGQVLISGYLPLKNPLSQEIVGEGKLVHADGEVKITTPYRFKFYITEDMTINTSDDNTISLKRRDGESDFDFVKRAANKKMRKYAKENSIDMSYVVNNDLNFTQKENIIEVEVIFEITEEIGKEQEITYGIR